MRDNNICLIRLKHNDDDKVAPDICGNLSMRTRKVELCGTLQTAMSNYVALMTVRANRTIEWCVHGDTTRIDHVLGSRINRDSMLHVYAYVYSHNSNPLHTCTGPSRCVIHNVNIIDLHVKNEIGTDHCLRYLLPPVPTATSRALHFFLGYT